MKGAGRIRALAVAKLAKRNGLDTSQIIATLAIKGCGPIDATLAIRQVEALGFGEAKKAILDHASYAFARIDWDAVAKDVENELNAESGRKPGVISEGGGK